MIKSRQSSPLFRSVTKYPIILSIYANLIMLTNLSSGSRTCLGYREQRSPDCRSHFRPFGSSRRRQSEDRQKRESVRTKFSLLDSARQWAKGTECPITRVILVCNKPAPRCQLGVTAQPPSPRARAEEESSPHAYAPHEISFMFLTPRANVYLATRLTQLATLWHPPRQAGVGSTILIHTSNPAMIAPPTASSRKLHLGYEM